MALESLLSFIILGLTTIHASPTLLIRDSPITVPIATHINMTGGSLALLNAERARIAAVALGAQSAHHSSDISSLEARKTVPVPVMDAVVTYVCEVGVGTPPTQYSVLVDTGSSNTWIGANTPYKVTSTSRETSNKVSVSYGLGSFRGTEWTDTVSIGSAHIKEQSIGVASFTRDFSGVDGILGIGPTNLTLGTLSPNRTEIIPTVTDNLKLQHFISASQVGISFEPTSSLNAMNGQLDFGGTDRSKYTGQINYVDVPLMSTAASYWGVTQGVTYGSLTRILPPLSTGIVDTGTTLLYLRADAFERYQSATGGKNDPNTGLLKITSKQYDDLSSLFFNIGGVQYEFTRNAQIWPRSLNHLIRGSNDSIYLVVANIGPFSGGLDFINGFAWLQRFYTSYDTGHRRVGFATTPYTYAESN